MKRFFLLFSNLLLTVFVVWLISGRVTQLRYGSYPSLFIHQIVTESPANLETLDAELEKLAVKTDSTIAKVLAVPQESGEANFFYQVYGHGKLPKELSPATEQMVLSYQKQATSYAIIDGPLTVQALVDFFLGLGYQAIPKLPESPWLFALFALSRGSQLLAVLICILTFTALTLIYRITELKAVGINLLSGQSLLSISLASILKDIIGTSIATLVSLLLGSAWLFYRGLGEWFFISFLLASLLIYQFILISISAFLTLVYVFGVRKNHILPIIKGRLPLLGLLSLMLGGQFLAITIVGVSLNRVLIYQNEMSLQEQSKSDWTKEPDLVNMSFNLAVGERDRQATYFDKWYPFINKAVEANVAMLVQNNLTQYVFSDQNNQGVKKTDYHPDGNTLYVTVNYLDKQSIDVDAKVRQQLEELLPGQYGLLLPYSLKDRANDYVELYSKELNDRFKTDESTALQPINPIVGYLSDGREYFLYNQTAITSQQYLTDPIIVVITPKSTGSSSLARQFWGNAFTNHLFFSDYATAKRLLEEEQLLPYISYIENSRLLYQRQLEHIASERLLSLGGSILGIATSVLLFQSMNLLYFEQFRREIFIKRLSGLGFLQLHRDYLTAQLAIFFLAFAVLVWLKIPLFLNSLTFLIFWLNALLTLIYRAHREKLSPATVLKGA
ncbi:putative ABC transport system permease protein [Streptococcus rupicaprae]|uniref:ABC transport system permease protein n=1 Tax=Streptococcus rupicaprae TaxID=759619 RepID=A0ABV2FHF1_9STRE